MAITLLYFTVLYATAITLFFFFFLTMLFQGNTSLVLTLLEDGVPFVVDTVSWLQDNICELQFGEFNTFKA